MVTMVDITFQIVPATDRLCILRIAGSQSHTPMQYGTTMMPAKKSDGFRLKSFEIYSANPKDITDSSNQMYGCISHLLYHRGIPLFLAICITKSKSTLDFV
jgi:hypothetical protein